MRTLSHLTPRYVAARATNIAYQTAFRDRPWLTRRSIAFLDRSLGPQHRGLEWGSGRGTIWFARRIGALTSVETDPVWFARLRIALDRNGLTNVELLLLPEPDDVEDAIVDRAYVRVADRFEPESIDIVLVDGVHRLACAVAALPKVAPGGMLVLDNANWYLPSESRAPRSRRPTEGPASEAWGEFHRRVAGWDQVWTTNGVFDTAIWRRPVPG
jgi:predicted O-methyltransferase YrrM